MRRLYTFLLFLVLISLSSCSSVTPTADNPNASTEMSPELYCGSAYCYASLREDRALYFLNTGNCMQLRLFDAASKTDIPYCFDPGCEHLPTKFGINGEILYKGCISFDYSLYPVKVTDNQIFFLQSSGELLCADLQGENRKTIAQIPDYVFDITDSFFTEDSLFLLYSVPYELIEIQEPNGEKTWMLGERKEQNDCGVLQISLLDGSKTRVFQGTGYSAKIFTYDSRNIGHIYFAYSYRDTAYAPPTDSASDGAKTSSNNAEANNKKTYHHTIYDYDLSSQTLRAVLSVEGRITVQFGNGFFCIIPESSTETASLYRYDGSPICSLSFHPGVSAIFTETDLLCFSAATGEYLLIDSNTGSILKRTSVPPNSFIPVAILGDSCYGTWLKNGSIVIPAYLSATDFWNGDLSGMLPLAESERQK